MCSCIWLAPPRSAFFFLAICGVGHPLFIIIWFNKVVVVVVVVENKIELKVDFGNRPGLTQFSLLFCLQGWKHSMPYMKIIHISDNSTSL